MSISVNQYIETFNILPTNNELVNYYFYKECFLEDISTIENLVPENSLEEGNISGIIDKSYRSSHINWIEKNDASYDIYKKLIRFVKDANKNMWNFRLNSFTEDLQYSEYSSETNGHYDWHLDIGENQSSTRKLSISIQLSDPEDYEGGELQFLTGRHIRIAPKSKGTMILFPSYMLHRITPVTKGVRKSLVYWVHGEPFC